MGILWWMNKEKTAENKPQFKKSKPGDIVQVMNGAIEVQRIPKYEITVFEFGSVSASADKITLAGYCPVSEDLEPCRWEIIPANDSNDPQFRLVF